jgi:hypothetical protein
MSRSIPVGPLQCRPAQSPVIRRTCDWVGLATCGVKEPPLPKLTVPPVNSIEGFQPC